jgi:pyruvate/oxaloacetate carboxyltransferase
VEQNWKEILKERRNRIRKFIGEDPTKLKNQWRRKVTGRSKAVGESPASITSAALRERPQGMRSKVRVF